MIGQRNVSAALFLTFGCQFIMIAVDGLNGVELIGEENVAGLLVPATVLMTVPIYQFDPAGEDFETTPDQSTISEFDGHLIASEVFKAPIKATSACVDANHR